MHNCEEGPPIQLRLEGGFGKDLSQVMQHELILKG